ncbi:MAG: hypothetical protein KAX30_07230, partial [Candidatus Atribacteria bacterium]|nr:hypothetical protein [Candidatus Atribacteria bacterium]
RGIVKGNPFISLIASAGVWSKAYMSISKETDKLFEVAKAVPMNRSTKADQIISPAFFHSC